MALMPFHLGPPGTGKTRSTSEIVLRCSTQQKRVLITSGTHQAVDNMLERLPTTLTAIRYGHEDNVLPSTRYLLAEEQAKKNDENRSGNTQPSPPLASPIFFVRSRPFPNGCTTSL